jgi:demethylmenaquinone methyltransferase/2-methoxy-6-polyprenyl-1,4-benzoquinol methylase
MHHNSEQAAACAARAVEFERDYERPSCQQDLARLREIISTLLEGRRILELACGTGYWTEFIARIGRTVLAVDVDQERLQIAAARLRCFGNTALLVDDAFSLSNIDASSCFDACLAAFWWSHVPRGHLPAFLDHLHAKLGRKAVIVFADERFVEGVSHPLARTDGEGNTYQRHVLGDGTEVEELRNFPQPADLKALLAGRSRGLTIHQLQHYWCMSYMPA